MKVFLILLFVVFYMSNELEIHATNFGRHLDEVATYHNIHQNDETTFNHSRFGKNFKKASVSILTQTFNSKLIFSTKQGDEIDKILLKDKSFTTTAMSTAVNFDTIWSSTSTSSEPPPSTLLTTTTIMTSSSKIEILPTNPHSSTPIVATSPDPYIPCQSWISFSYDDSNSTSLSPNYFITQINFIAAAIGAINHVERIQAIGIFSQSAIWNSGFSIQQLQNSVNSTTQGGAYNLRGQLADLVTNLEQLQNTTIPIGTLIFISDTSNAALAGAEQFKDMLSKIHLTFVLLGPNADQNKLTNYSKNFIFWSNLSHSQPDNWDTNYLNAYGCSNVATTALIPPATTVEIPNDTTLTIKPSSPISISGSTLEFLPTNSPSSTPFVTPSSIPYIPCQSWISFSFDDSKSLSDYMFFAQINFISSVIRDLNHLERLQIIGMFSQPVSFKSGLSIEDIHEGVNYTQGNYAYSLKAQLEILATSLKTLQNNSALIGTLIFISDTSDDALYGADEFQDKLSDIHLTFVLLGTNTDENKLINFSSNFIYWKNMSQAHPENWDAAYLNAYGCNDVITSPPPTPKATTLIPYPLLNTTATTTTTAISNTTTTQEGIHETPPPPILNCNSEILQPACQANITEDTPPANVSQIFNDTQNIITNKIKNDSLTTEDVHDAGAFLYNITSTVKKLTTEAVHSAVDIVSVILNQPIKNLEEADNQTNGAMLWFIASIPQIVDLSDSDINITRENLQLNSQSLNEFCELKDSKECAAKEICQETENGKFCATFDPKQLCGTGAKKAYLALWNNLAFYIVSNNANKDGIKLGSDSKKEKTDEENNNINSTNPLFFDNAGDCETGTYFQTNAGANGGGTGGNNQIQAFSTKLKVNRKRDQNDLHVKVKLGIFIGGVFTVSDTVARGKDNYEAICIASNTTGNVMCTLILEGNTSDPITCNSYLRIIEIFFGAIGVAVTIFSFIAFIMFRRPMPPQVRFCFTFFKILLDNSLSSKARKFAFAYNIIFTLYIIYLMIFSYKKSLANDWICTTSAVVGYLLYLCGIFLTIIMLIVTLEELGNWRPTFQFSLQLINGFEKTYVPFIYGFGFPLILTFMYAATMPAFFNRNDGYCWVRPDYLIQALWIPLGLLLISLPLYIPLIARQWPTFCCANFINRLCYCEGGGSQPNNFEAEQNSSTTIESQNYFPNEKTRNNHIISRLIFPQVCLGIPLIAENFTLYYAKLTGYHYAFILTLAAHLIILYSVSVYLSYKTARPPSSPPLPIHGPDPDLIVPEISIPNITIEVSQIRIEELSNESARSLPTSIEIHVLKKDIDLEFQPFMTRTIKLDFDLVNRRPSGGYDNMKPDSSVESESEIENDNGFHEPLEIKQQNVKKEDRIINKNIIDNYVVEAPLTRGEENIRSQCLTKNFKEDKKLENEKKELTTVELLNKQIEASRKPQFVKNQITLVNEEKNRSESQDVIFCRKGKNFKSGGGTEYENNKNSEKSETEDKNMSATEASQISTINFEDSLSNGRRSDSSSSSNPFSESENDFEGENEKMMNSNSDENNHFNFTNMEEKSEENKNIKIIVWKF